MKKILSFILLGLMCSIGNVKAQETIFLWQSDGSTTTKETVFSATGGTAAFYGSANPSTESAAYNEDVTDNDLKATGSKGHKLGTNTLYLKIALTSETLQEGDIIYICGYKPYRVGTGVTSNRANTDLAEALATGTAKGDYNIGSVVVPADVASQDVTEIYLSRAEGTGTGLAAVKIVRPAPSAPKITTQPVGASYVTGDPISALTVEATASAGTLTYQWFSCNDALKTNAQAIDGATNASYTPSAAGFYFVKVTDSNGNVDSDVVEIAISAAAAPTITTDLEATANVIVNVPQEFAIVATGNPAPTYQWYLDGAAIDGATSASYTYTATAVGTHSLFCIASNGVGENAWSTACAITAALPAAPTISTNLPTTANTFVGVKYKLGIVSANADEYNVNLYQWYKDGVAIVGATNTNYEYKAEAAGSAEFYCTVSNAGGTINSATCTITASSSTILNEDYSSDIPSDFTFPTWMAYTAITTANTAGCVFNGTYNGSDKDVSGTTVLRLSNNDTLYMYIHGTGELTVKCSATGTRTVRIDANGVEIANSESFSKNTLKTVKGLMPSAGDNIVKFYQVGSNGGLTISEISFVPSKITLGANGYSTYAADYKYTVSGATVYTAAYNAVQNAVVLTEVAADAVIPANAGIILKGTEGDPVSFIPSAASAADFSDNKLVGVVSATTAPADAYALATNLDGDGLTKFHPCTDIEIPANKAYIVIAANPSAPDAIRIEFAENGATGINELEGAEKAVKFIENGKLYIQKDGVVYDATGAKVK